MKNKFIFLLAFVVGNIVAMDKPCDPALLHTSLHGFLEPQLRCWLINMTMQHINKVPACIQCYKSPICKLAITQDGYTLVTASEDNKIRIWDCTTGICKFTLEGHTGPIEDLKIISAHNCIISASQDCTVRRWNISNGLCMDVMSKHSGPVVEINVTPDGLCVITRSKDNTACVWNLITGILTSIDCNPNTLARALITPDGKIVITRSIVDSDLVAMRSGTIFVRGNIGVVQAWDAADGRCLYTLPGHPYRLSEYKYETLEQHMARRHREYTKNIGSGPKTFEKSRHPRWDITYSTEYSYFNNGRIDNFFLSPDGKKIITTDKDKYNGAAIVWDVTSGTQTRVLQEPDYSREHEHIVQSAVGCPNIRIPDPVTEVAFAPNGNNVVVFTRLSDWNVPLRFVNLATGNQQKLNTCGYSLKSVSWCADSTTVIGCSKSHTLHMWDLNSHRLFMLENSDPEALSKLAKDNVISLPDITKCPFDRREREWEAKKFGVPMNYQCSTGALLSNCPCTAVTTSANHILVWNLPEGTLRHCFTNPSIKPPWFWSRTWQYCFGNSNKSYDAMAMNEQGTCLVKVASDGYTAHVWDIKRLEHQKAVEQLSVLQVALLKEIQHRQQTDAQRLILRQGSDNWQAYQSLPNIIKDIARSHIGIHH